MLQALRSNLRRTIITTLVFGALTVVGLAALPLQSAHAAASNEASASVVQEKGKPIKPTVVKCYRSASGSIWDCNKTPIVVGSIVEANINDGECTFQFKVEEVNADETKARGYVVMLKPKKACKKAYGLENGDWIDMEYVEKTSKDLPEPYPGPFLPMP